MNTDEYIQNDAVGDALISAATTVGEGRCVVCPHGHVHLVVGDKQITLSPEDAELWVEVLYDAAQKAQEEATDE